MTRWTTRDLHDLPRRGWIRPRAPVEALPARAKQAGLASLHVKRDDRCSRLPGGTKVRKLDVVLAAPPWREAPRWASVGAIGSGHLVALTACAAELDRTVEAHLFWEPLSQAVVGNLAYVASGPTELHYHRNRLGLALTQPRLALGRAPGPAIGPGACQPLGTLGVVRGALELAEQVEAGELPPPDAVWVPLGSGGTAAGLSLGLALAGIEATVWAVAAVEPLLSSRSRFASVQQEALGLLRRQFGAPADLEPAPVELLHGYVGRRYGHPSAASLAACDDARGLGLPLEPVYSGKAWAALADRVADLAGQHVLFWLTPHGRDLPRDDDWRDRLPPRLARRLRASDRWGPSRRALIGGGLAVAAAGAAAVRLGGYGRMSGWSGRVLAPWEAEVIAAAAEALIPPGPDAPWPTGPGPAQVAANADAYLQGMPAPLQREIHGLVALVEHGTGLSARLPRLTRLAPAARLAFLEHLKGLGGPLPFAVRGLRDLCLLGFWQDPSTWPVLGYDGPYLPPRRTRRDDLVAPPGALPRGIVP